MVTGAAAEIITLSHGLDRCHVIPEIGGSLAAWQVNDRPLMRVASTANIAARDPLGMASFPLVPYSNRIANATFEWNGKLIRLSRNFPPEPHSIHGVGFRRPWRVEARTKDSIEMALEHAPDADWPWAFRARQRISLRDRLLQMDLSATNLATTPVPLAFGHHPYFPKRGAFLTFLAHGVWLKGDDGLPTERVEQTGPFDYSKGRPVEYQEIDHCFSAWSGLAHIEWRDEGVRLEIAGSPELPDAVVCVRSDLDDFCFEPVPHVNNALNRPDQRSYIPIVEPGKAYQSNVRFRAVPR